MEWEEREIARIVEDIKACTRCQLYITALQSVVYRGTVKKGVVMFVGEAPGTKEDLEGKPFVGASGKMLDKLIQQAGVQEFYISNVVKHIPRKGVGVRTPTPEEVAKCCSYLEEEIRILEPSLIVALGGVALKHLAGLDKVVKWKGQTVETKYGKVFVLPHPSYYLRRGLSEYPVEDVEALRNALTTPRIYSAQEEEKREKGIQEPEKVFYPLHLHTTYSVGDGYGTPAQYKKRLVEIGVDAAAITDHGTLGGVVEWTRTLSPEIRPLVGEEIYLCRSAEKTKTRYHVTLLAKNAVGWRNLLELHYLSHSEFFYYRPRIPFSEFLRFQEGLIVLTGCPLTPFVEHEDWLDKLLEVRNGEDVYVEIQPLENFRRTFDRMIELASKYNLPVVMTNDIHYPCKEDAISRGLVLQIVRNEENGQFAEDVHHLLSWQEAKSNADRFGWPEEWLSKTKEVVDKVEFRLEKFGRFPLPHFDYNIEDRFSPEAGKEERWNLELGRLRRKNYYDYFQLIRGILDIADELGVSYGPGRGSVGGSYIAYRMGIHKADPFKFDLIFDRFLSEARIDVPDIDMDFEHTRQVELIEALREKFGETRVVRVGSWSTWADRGVARDLAKILKQEEVDHYLPKLIGQVRHRGLHAAGVVICGEELYKHIPVERSSEQLVSAWDRDSLDYMRVPKIDILGLKNVTVIKEIMQMAELEELPSDFDDKRVYREIFGKMRTLGVFQFGTGLMTGVARYATCFEDLVLINALVRPGARDFTEEWIAMKTGRKKPNYLHEKVKEITENTMGLVLYQEQVMRIVSEVGGLSWEEAEEFRKVTAKTGDRELLRKYEKKFLEGAVRNGLTHEQAVSIYSTILAFAGYSFNKSHAVFYSMLGYWTAWLKLYYPEAFYLVTLKYETETDRIIKLIQELKDRGFRIERPCVNNSQVFYSLTGGVLRVGLACIKGIGQSFADVIVKHSPYRNLLELIGKTGLNASQLKALAAAGALDDFKIPRGYLYVNAETIVRGSVAFFGAQKVDWTESQKEEMFTKYVFSAKLLS